MAKQVKLNVNSSSNLQLQENLTNKCFGKKQSFQSLNKIIRLFIITLSYIIISSSYPKVACGPNNKCYILALEGGGDKGAYQAGAIAGLIENLDSNLTQYDVLTGISVGALNAAGFSIFEIGSEKAAAEFLLSVWRELKGQSSVFENWMFGPLEGLLFKTGLYSTVPLHGLLERLINGEGIKRKLVIGATNIENGTYHTWDEEDFEGDSESFVTGVMASSAFPVIFPNIAKDNTSYMDGGVKNSIDIPSGINKCLDMGYSMENIIIDTILCSATNVLPQVDINKLHPVNVLIRVLEIYGYDNSMRDLEDILYDFPKTNFRYVIAPTKKLPGSYIPLTFAPDQIEQMIQIGIDDAKNAIKYGESGNFKNVIEEYRKKRRSRIGVKKMKLLD